jgi:hypothetical protein
MSDCPRDYRNPAFLTSLPDFADDGARAEIPGQVLTVVERCGDVTASEDCLKASKTTATPRYGFAIQSFHAEACQTSGEFFFAAEVPPEAGRDVSGNTIALKSMPGSLRGFRRFRTPNPHRNLALYEGFGPVSYAGGHAGGHALSQEKRFSVRSDGSGLAPQSSS